MFYCATPWCHYPHHFAARGDQYAGVAAWDARRGSRDHVSPTPRLRLCRCMFDTRARAYMCVTNGSCISLLALLVFGRLRRESRYCIVVQPEKVLCRLPCSGIVARYWLSIGFGQRLSILLSMDTRNDKNLQNSRQFVNCYLPILHGRDKVIGKLVEHNGRLRDLKK